MTLALGSNYSAIGAMAGLTGLIAATLIPPFTGSSRFHFNTPGPAAAGILGALGGNIVVQLGDVPNAPELALGAMFLCALFVGIFHVLIGQLHLGNLIKLIPQTVITGVLNGILVVVAIYQLPWLFGVTDLWVFADPPTLIRDMRWADFGIGATTIVSVYVSRRLIPRIPPLLSGMIVGTALYWLVSNLTVSALGATIGRLPSGLPSPARVLDIVAFAQSHLLFALLPDLLMSALAITMVTAIGALVTAASADSITNSRHNPVGELTGLGAGNMVAAIFSGVPSGGSPTNVLLNFKNGGRSRMAHVLTTVILLGCLLGLGGVIGAIPLSVIAGVLIIMSIEFFDRWPVNLARRALVMRPSELRTNVIFNLALIVIVMVMTVVSDLVIAVVIGLVLELLHFLLRSGESLVRRVYSGSSLHSNVVRDEKAIDILQQKGDSIRIVSMQGTLFFGNTDYLAGYLEDSIEKVDTVILNVKGISDIDTSGVRVLARIDDRFAQLGKRLFFAHLSSEEDLGILIEEYGLVAPQRQGRVFEDLNSALAAAENLLLQENGYESLTEAEFPLTSTVPFVGLSQAELDLLNLEKRHFEKGEYVMREGEPADGLYVLVKGRLSIVRSESRSRKAISLVNFGPGVNVGEMALLGAGKRTADVIAREPAVLYFMSKETFETLCNDAPAAAVTILRNIAGSLSLRLSEASRSITELETQ